MSVTLEKVDEVRNRTGASYSEAKEALEFTGGDVLEAIVYIEQMRQEPPKKRTLLQTIYLIEAVKSLRN